MTPAPRDRFDRYYTDPAPLVAYLDSLGPTLRDLLFDGIPPRVLVEPCVGGGTFVRTIEQQVGGFHRWIVGDVDPDADLRIPVPYERPCAVEGVRGDGRDLLRRVDCDVVITNPPYNEAAAFVQCALGSARLGVIMLLRLGFLASQRRAALFAADPVARLTVLSRRPSFTADGRTDRYDYGFFAWSRDPEVAGRLRERAIDHISF